MRHEAPRLSSSYCLGFGTNALKILRRLIRGRSFPLEEKGVIEEEGVTSLKFLHTIYRNPEVPLPVRMKAAAIAIEYELPRLAVTASIHGGDFADQLERALKRSLQIIEAVVESKPTTNPALKPMIPDRRFRR
jgi:hypothetical protein